MSCCSVSVFFLRATGSSARGHEELYKIPLFLVPESFGFPRERVRPLRVARAVCIEAVVVRACVCAKGTIA